MKNLSDIETTASTTVKDQNADQYVIAIDGGHRIFARTTEPSSAGEVDGDFWFELP